MFDFISNVTQWFGSPGIAPWAGALAAVIAALTVDTKPWLKTPRKGGVRALRVLLVWLLVAALFGLGGGGPGGPEKGGAQGDASTSTAGSTPAPKTERIAPADPAPEPFPAAAPNVVLVVRFLAAPGAENEAQDLSCDLVFRQPKGARTVELRAADMAEFESAFARELRDYALPGEQKSVAVVVHRKPFPGEGALRKVEQLIRAAWPSVAVRFDE